MRVKPEREDDFRLFFSDAFADALRFAQRRIASDRAEDVVAEAMLVAWRRFDDAPGDPGERRAWLFGIVRNTILNASRSEARQPAVAVKIIDAATIVDTPDHAVAADNSYVRGMEGQFAIGGQVFSVVSGSVGAGVASVTLRGADDEAVATITNGKYAAWVPGPMFERLDAPSGEGGPEAILFYDLTLDDGTVLRDALPEYRATE